MLVFSLTIQKGNTRGLTLDEIGGGTKGKNVDLSQPDFSPPNPLSDTVTLLPLRGSQPAPVRDLGVSRGFKCFAYINLFHSRGNAPAVMIAICR